MGTGVSAFAAELRRQRIRNALSLRTLAQRTHHSKTVLWEWESGEKIPTAQVAAQLDAILDARGRLVALRRDAITPDPQQQLADESRLLAEQLAAARPGELVAQLEQDTERLALAYLVSPGAALFDEVTDARRAAMTALKGRRLRNPHQVRYLTAAVGYLSGILAYAALDDGHPHAALIHTEAAWQAADAADADQQRAWVRGTQSLILRFMQRYAEALTRADDGLRYATSGTSRSRLLAGIGQCHANMGDAPAARRSLAEAETAFDQQRGSDEAGGLFTFSRAKLLYYSGSSLIWLEGGDDARQATEQAHQAIDLWAAGGADRSVADETLSHVYAATGSLQVHELEEAAADLAAVLSVPEQGRISWIGKRLERIEGMLQQAPYQRDPLAAELLESIHAYR